MDESDFALQWLDFLDTKIFYKDTQLFKAEGDAVYEISPLVNQIEIGQPLASSKSEYSFLPYDEVRRLGYIVVAGTRFIWRSGQRCHFHLQKRVGDAFGISEDVFKKKLQVRHDPANRAIQLVGTDVVAAEGKALNSGVGPWITYAKDKPKKKKHGTVSRESIRAANKKWAYGDEEEPEFMQFAELPIMISDEQYIVCVKKSNECQRFIITGGSGQGKSLLSNALSGRIFYLWEDRVGWIIDPLDQFDDICFPQDAKIFNDMNALVGNEPKPIPAIQLYRACGNRIDVQHPKTSLTYALNFAEFLRKYKFYTFGIKDYDVGSTIRYLMDFYKDLKNVTTANEIRDIMMERIPNAHKDKGTQAMIYKWVNTFETIFKEKFTANLYRDDRHAVDELAVKFPDGTEYKGHPFIALLLAGAVPVYNVAAARRERWLRNDLADLMQKIVRHQSNVPEKEKKRVWLIADELNEIYEKGKKLDNASTAFEELYRQGRFNKVGFIGNTQSLEKLNPEMVKNATHVCCFNMKSKKERKMIGETYQVDKEIYEKIGTLKKKEMVMFSHEPFIVYDRWGKRRVIEDRRWFKGKLFPPINHHKMPQLAEK